MTGITTTDFDETRLAKTAAIMAAARRRVMNAGSIRVNSNVVKGWFWKSLSRSFRAKRSAVEEPGAMALILARKHSRSFPWPMPAGRIARRSGNDSETQAALFYGAGFFDFAPEALRSE